MTITRIPVGRVKERRSEAVGGSCIGVETKLYKAIVLVTIGSIFCKVKANIPKPVFFVLRSPKVIQSLLIISHPRENYNKLTSSSIMCRNIARVRSSAKLVVTA